jgi:hypothetical protein
MRVEGKMKDGTDTFVDVSGPEALSADYLAALERGGVDTATLKVVGEGKAATGQTDEPPPDGAPPMPPPNPVPPDQQAKPADEDFAGNVPDPTFRDPDETRIESELQAKGKTAPRLTPDDISATIADVKFVRIEGTTVMVCALVLRNGFVVIGHAASASP